MIFEHRLQVPKLEVKIRDNAILHLWTDYNENDQLVPLINCTLISFLIDLFFLDCTSPFEVSVVTDATTDAIPGGIANANQGNF